MIDLDSVFKNKCPDSEKLISYGFRTDGAEYMIETPIMDNQFLVSVCVGSGVSFSVTEMDTGDEYVLVRVESAQGGFVGEVRQHCLEVLSDIAEKCFVSVLFGADQANRTAEFIERELKILPDFPFGKFADCAVFRNAANKKWFAIVMTVSKIKAGIAGEGNAVIIDIKATPEKVARLLSERNYYPAYHMNKKNWITVVFDDTVKDEELFPLIAEGYSLVSKK